MAYFIQADLEALIPAAWIVEGLDDDGDGEVDAFGKVQSLAEGEINGVLSARYAVPMDTTGNAGLADFLKTLAVLIAVEAIYERRGKEMLESRMKRLSDARKRLVSIAAGDDPLSPAIKPVLSPGVILGETSRAYSNSLPS